ncbi:MAG: bifunctional metallophosphatase/5'-nucleotidase [Lentisphaeria bacterium]|nr:bifunctional metallophosphatase/5'-nucleotidase [Lentisphaeria bacterium]
MNRLISRILFLYLSVAGVVLSASEISLKVIQTADLHGCFRKGALAKTASVIRAEYGDGSGALLIDCGDFAQGSFASTLDRGTGMVSYLNRMKYDLLVPGNHDFEFGTAALARNLQVFEGTVCALNLAMDDVRIVPWKAFHRKGLKIVVIGIAYPALERMYIGDPFRGFRMFSVKQRLEKIIPSVMAEKPAVIILAMHAGNYTWLDQDFNLYHLLRKYPQIDLVLTSHSHQAEAGKSAGSHSWRMQAPAYGGAAVAEIVYDTQMKKIISLKSRVVPLEPHQIEDPQIRELSTSILKDAAVYGNQPIAYCKQPLSVGKKRKKGSFDTMCAAAIRQHTRSDIVFFRSSGRWDQPPGVLTRQELYSLLPYETYPAVIPLTQQELRAVLKEQLTRRADSFLFPDGLRYHAKGKKLISFTVEQSGKKEEYRCAFSSYALAGGGSAFPVLRGIALKKWNKIEFFPETIRSVLEKYLKTGYPYRKK